MHVNNGTGLNQGPNWNKKDASELYMPNAM